MNKKERDLIFDINKVVQDFIEKNVYRGPAIDVEIIVIGSLEYSKQFFSHAFLMTRKALKNKKK